MDKIASVTKLVHCQTIQRLNDQLLSISQGHISKAEASNNQITLLQSQLAQMTDKVDAAGILAIQTQYKKYQTQSVNVLALEWEKSDLELR